MNITDPFEQLQVELRSRIRRFVSQIEARDALDHFIRIWPKLVLGEVVVQFGHKPMPVERGQHRGCDAERMHGIRKTANWKPNLGIPINDGMAAYKRRRIHPLCGPKGLALGALLAEAGECLPGKNDGPVGATISA